MHVLAPVNLTEAFGAALPPAMAALGEAGRATGAPEDAAVLMPRSGNVRFGASVQAVVDGPFAETKELVTG